MRELRDPAAFPSLWFPCGQKTSHTLCLHRLCIIPFYKFCKLDFPACLGGQESSANHIHHSEQVLFRRLFHHLERRTATCFLWPCEMWHLQFANKPLFFSPGVNKADFGPFTVTFPGLRCVCVIIPRDNCSEILFRICSSKRVNEKWEKKKNHIRQKHTENKNSWSQQLQNKVMVWN